MLLLPFVVSLAAADQPRAAPGSSECAQDALSVLAETHHLAPVRREVIVKVRPGDSGRAATPTDRRTPFGQPRLVMAVLPFDNGEWRLGAG